MNFKDKRYYINKTKYYLGLTATASMFALIVFCMFVFA